MKYFVLAVLFFSTFTWSIAQSSMIVNDKVSITSNFDLDFVMNAHLDKNEHYDLADGYRIQIANSSNREEVYAKKADVYTNFTAFKAYIVYDQPYYKLRIGDFKSKMEARKFLDQIILVYPTAFLVRDEIKIK